MHTTIKRWVVMAAIGVSAAGNCPGGEAPPKPPEHLVSFGGADAALPEIQTGHQDFQFPLRIASSGQGEVKDVSVFVNPFWGPDGKQVVATCSVDAKSCEKFDIASGQTREAVVAAKLGYVGTYSALVTLKQGDHLQSRLVKITRVARDATFSLTGGEQATDRELWVTLVDTAGEETKLLLPQVLNLTRNQKNKTPTQAKFKSLQILDEANKPVVEPINLAASKSQRRRVKFKGLEPGEYSGKLLFAAQNGSKSREFEIKQLTARWGWGWALLPILLGALVSLALRKWATQYRPILVKRRSIASMLVDLEDTLPPPLVPPDKSEVSVEATVRKQIEVIEHALDVDEASTFDARMPVLLAKVELLPLWMLARRRVASLEPPSLQQQFQDSLQAGQYFLVTQHAAADDPSIMQVRELDGKITTAVKAELRRQVKELRDQVEAGISKSRRQEHRDLLTENLLPLVSKLERAIESDDDSVSGLLEDARREFALALIADLRLTLEEPAPATIEASDWNALKEKLLKELDGLPEQTTANQLAQKYRRAIEIYVETLASLLVMVVKKRILVVENSSLSAADKPKFLTDLQSIGVELNAISQDSREPTKQAKATVDLERMIARLNSIAADYLQLTGVQMSGGNQVRAPVGQVNQGASIPEGLADNARQPLPQIPARVDQRSKVKHFAAWIKTGDGITTIAAGAIALVLGMKAVYVDNPGWGGFDDWLVALLWGLGLHQGASGVFEGIAGLKKKFI